MTEIHERVDPEERRELVRFVREQGVKLDDRFFFLSTGALALSITFKDSFVPQDPDVLWVLAGSWLLFLLCIVSFLINRAIGLGRANALTLMMALEEREEDMLEYIFNPPRFVKALWWVELGAFVLGVGLLVIFALANIGGTSS